MSSQSKAPIAEAVGLLNKFAPAELARLRNELPAEMTPYLTGGGLAGEVPAALKARATVQLSALKQIAKQIKDATAGAERRLKLSKRIRLAGDIFAIVGSSSVLVGSSASGAAAKSEATVLISGSVALLGALAGALSDYALKLPDGGGGLFEVYAGLGESRYEAETLGGEIEALLGVDANDDTNKILEKLVGDANVLCRKVLKSFSLVLQHT